MTSASTLERDALRGADVLATRCLCVRAGELVRVLTWGADDLSALTVRALERAGASVTVEAVARLASITDAATVQARVAALLRGCAASVFMSDGSSAGHVSIAIVRAAEAASVRHIHIPRADVRVFASSVRADPDALRAINQRVHDLLSRSGNLAIESDAGTRLDVSLAAAYPILNDCGVPTIGHWENLPSGYVYFHPASISGVYVADRVAFGGGIDLTSAAARKALLTLTIERGRIVAHQSRDSHVDVKVSEYLTSHPDAGRVGFVSIPTNYLARAELGHNSHDGLMPGLKLHFGFSDARATRAPFDAPVQFRVQGRLQTIRAGRSVVVDAGRLSDTIMAGIDPLR